MRGDEQSFAIIGAAMSVHRELGHGFLEAVYQEALAVELMNCAVPFAREVALPIRYRRQRLNTGYRADFLCFDEVIVEVKALERLTTREKSQVINYLKASGRSARLAPEFWRAKPGAQAPGVDAFARAS